MGAVVARNLLKRNGLRMTAWVDAGYPGGVGDIELEPLVDRAAAYTLSPVALAR